MACLGKQYQDTLRAMARKDRREALEDEAEFYNRVTVHYEPKSSSYCRTGDNISYDVFNDDSDYSHQIADVININLTINAIDPDKINYDKIVKDVLNGIQNLVSREDKDNE